MSRRRLGGPTGQPGRHVADTCDADTADTVPTNPSPVVSSPAGRVSVVVVAGPRVEVVDDPGTVVVVAADGGPGDERDVVLLRRAMR